MGSRGEGWVALQIFLFALVLLAPEIEALPFPLWLRALGLLILCGGGIVGTLGVLNLGQSLSPFPKPKEGGQLVTTGIYGIVRHPIYAGIILGTLGWSLLTGTLLGVALAIVLFIFFDMKSRREERWLSETYSDYPTYQKQVRKLIPWLY